MLQKVLAKLTAYTANYPQEKVYLHLDKPYYAAGEDVWFKAYLVNADNHAPSLLSQVMYVDLINQEDSLFSRLAVNVKNGVGHGDFALPDTIPAGQYRLRAYTSWMQNFGQDYFFHRNLQIFNPRVDDMVVVPTYSYKRQGSGDSVLVNLSLKNLWEELLAQVPLSYSLQTSRKTSGRRKGVTNAAGETQLRFYLPDGENRQQAQILLTVNQDKQSVQKRIPVPGATQKVDLQFFPEGGELVNGMWSVVGFKAIAANGLGRDVQGEVYDNTGAKVTSFKSLKWGMGRFGFLPQKGKQYHARLLNTDGAIKEYPLPVAREKGVILTVNSAQPDVVQLKAFIVGYAGGDGRPEAVSIVGQSRGTVYFTAYTTTAKDLLLINVPKRKLPTGITQFTLFSSTGEPLAERLVFVNHQDQLRLTVTADKPSYKSREKVTMQVQAADTAGRPVVGHFSVAVTDAQKVMPEPYAPTLLSNLLLTSDLRGHVEHPGYYFSAKDPEAPQALDNLMLTQGWRRFTWKDVLEDKQPNLTYPLERGLAVSGTVLKLSGKPEPYAIVTLISMRPPSLILLDTADAQGKFAFGVSSLDDSARIVVQARNAKGKSNLEVVLDKHVPIMPIAPLPYFLPPSLLSQTQWAYLRGNREQLRLDQLSGKSILLSAVEIRAKKLQEEERMSRGLYSHADHTLKAESLPPGTDVISALSGRVAGLMVRGDNVSMRGAGPPLFLVDGMPIDIDFVRNLSMVEVETIDILKPGASSAIYGSQGGNGVIAINLKRGSSGGAASSTRYQGVAAYKGIRSQTPRQFYVPAYTKPEEAELPDLRTTLYWNPTVQTDATGKASFTFFAADAKTSYRTILEGVSTKGQLGRAEAEVLVK
ncbi:MG2 domain-containing protein [Rufibacter immobilis]|nr:MG2 domain-containing protein [Rufibacter immobilis]